MRAVTPRGNAITPHGRAVTPPGAVDEVVVKNDVMIDVAQLRCEVGPPSYGWQDQAAAVGANLRQLSARAATPLDHNRNRAPSSHHDGWADARPAPPPPPPPPPAPRPPPTKPPPTTTTSWRSAVKPLRNLALFVCLPCMLYAAVTSFAPAPLGLLEVRDDCAGNLTRCVCPRETVCARDLVSMLLLAVSRCTAYFDYPLYLVLFLTKLHNIRTFLARTPWSLYLPMHDLHQLHTAAGIVVGVETVVHASCHAARWVNQGNAHFLLTHVTGRSGLIAIAVTPLIVCPMLFPSLKRRFTWEFRRTAHYLAVVWGVAMCFHAPKMHIAYLFGSAVALYLADVLYGSLFNTHRIDNTVFTRIDCGSELTFENPAGYRADGAGYLLLNIPWLNKDEWHPFSVFPHPSLPGHSCICMLNNGDWTRALHKELSAPTTRPVFIAGPYASPYSTALFYDNLVLFASGVGVTPALAVVHHHSKSDRHVNLVWACREPALVEFYLRVGRFDPFAWTLIFYTGERPLNIDGKVPDGVLVLKGRPKFERVFRNIVWGIESGTMLPGAIHFAAAVATPDRSEDAGRQTSFERKRSKWTTVRSEFESGNLRLSAHGLDESNKHLVGLRKVAQAFEAAEQGAAGLPSIDRVTAGFQGDAGEGVDDSVTVQEFLGSLRAIGGGVKCLKRWAMMYCGGSQPVVDELTRIGEAYGVGLHVEKFDW